MPRCIRMPFTKLVSPEIALNCWYKHDLATGRIHAVAVQLYEVTGGDEEKLEFLVERSAIDYRTARFGRLPTEEGKLDSVVAELQMRNFPINLFLERMETATRELKARDISKATSKALRRSGGLSTDNILFTVTAICRTSEGSERAIISPEDEVWLDEQVLHLMQSATTH